MVRGFREPLLFTVLASEHTPYASSKEKGKITILKYAKICPQRKSFMILLDFRLLVGYHSLTFIEKRKKCPSSAMCNHPAPTQCRNPRKLWSDAQSKGTDFPRDQSLIIKLQNTYPHQHTTKVLLLKVFNQGHQTFHSAKMNRAC